MEIPPQNATTPLQEHQQKVIEADVVQSKAPELTAAATQNLVSFWIYLVKMLFVSPFLWVLLGFWVPIFVGSCGGSKARRDREVSVEFILVK